jgi:Flp pilus assembly protein TadG
MQAAERFSSQMNTQDCAQKSWYSSFAAKLRAFSGEKHGLAAMEFAYIMPFMAMIWVAMTVGSEAINANRKASQLAYTIGDMTSQISQITQTNLNAIFAASTSVLWPFEPSDVSLRITSYWLNEDKKAYIRWSAVPSDKNLSGEYTIKPECAKTVLINSNLIIPNSEIFLIETKVKYTASIGGAIANQIYGSSFTNNETAILEYIYIRPRLTKVTNTLPTLCTSDPYDEK